MDSPYVDAPKVAMKGGEDNQCLAPTNVLNICLSGLCPEKYPARQTSKHGVSKVKKKKETPVRTRKSTSAADHVEG